VLLSDPRVTQSIAGGSPLVQLCELMLQKLPAIPQPQQSPWVMPYSVPQYPSLEAFLRSDRETLLLSGCFSGVIQARSFVQHTLGAAIDKKIVTVNNEAGGSGKKAWVRITKKLGARNHRNKMIREKEDERKKYEDLLRSARAAGASITSPVNSTSSDIPSVITIPSFQSVPSSSTNSTVSVSKRQKTTSHPQTNHLDSEIIDLT
jgi:hypothetical protein